MKRRYFAVLMTSALILGGSAKTLRADGGQEGHGGDSYAAEFAAIADQLVNEIGGLPQVEREGVNPIQLGVAIDQTLVESTDAPLSLDNGARQVEAINYPDRSLIVMNREDWDTMSFARRQLLVLHEYSSVMGLDDSNYRISAKVILNLGGGIDGSSTSPNSAPSDSPAATTTQDPAGSSDMNPGQSTSPSPMPRLR